MKKCAETVRQYLYNINVKMNDLWNKNGAGEFDYQHLVPLDVLRNDDAFYDYIVSSNNE